MEHSKTPSPLIDARQVDIDPWNEFLSESSDELRTDAVESEGAEPGAASHSDNGASPASVVRVSFAELLPTPHAEKASHPQVTLTSSEAVDPIDRVSNAPASIPLVDALSRAAEQSKPVIEPPLSASAASVESAADTVADAVPSAPVIDGVAAMPAAGTPPSASASASALAAEAPHMAPVAVASMSLREVLRRHTPMHWSEAVATVEGLCLELTASNRAPLIPDLADILITADGHVLLRPGAPGDPDVATLGRTLHALLVTATTPLPLRLFVTSSVSSDRYASVALYLDALSYYAAPDRASLIHALYARALVSVAPMAPARVPVAETPVSVIERAASPVVPAKRPLPTLWIGILAGLLIGTVSAFWLWPATPSVRPSTFGAAVVPTEPPHDDWQPAPVQVPPTFRKRPPIVARIRSLDAPVPAPSTEPPPLPVRTAPLVSLPAPVMPTTPRTQQPPPVAETRSGLTPLPTPPAPFPGDATIYSAADVEVALPVLLSRRPLAPAETSRDASVPPTTFELVIDQKGNVQTTRVVGRPSRMTDMNVQQAVKNLTFRPAMKDGHPVVFKYVLHLEPALR